MEKPLHPMMPRSLPTLPQQIILLLASLDERPEALHPSIM